jgi:lysophospholipase L1-like esterase
VSSLPLWLTTGAAAAVAGVVSAELVARWWLRHEGAYYVWPPGFRRVLWPDREAVPVAEPVVRFEVNSAGERGDDLPESDEAPYRILTAGGSAVECMLLDQPTSWPGALQSVLSRAEHREPLGVSRVHVGNIGKSETDSQALDRILRHILPRYARLDVVIILVGASNILRWLAAGAPANTAAPPLPEGECFAWHPNGPFGFHPKRTALAQLARRVRLRLLRPTEKRERAGKFMTRTREMRMQAGPLCTTVPDPSAMLNAYEVSLRSALLAAMRYSNRVIVARQPWLDKPRFTAEEESRFWHGAVGDVFGGEVKRFVSSEALCGLMSQLDARTVAVAEELGLEHVDLREALEPSLCDYYDQFHFTPTGSAKVAEAVAAVVLRRAKQRQYPALSASQRADGN